MATIITRSGKGSPLTHAELDANFTNLNAAKLEIAGQYLTLAAAGIKLDNSRYIVQKIASGTETRILGLNVTDALFIGSIEATAPITQHIFVNAGAQLAKIDSVGNFSALPNANVSGQISVTNANAGTAADARFVASNGTATASLIMRGTANASGANQGVLAVSGANPLIFFTNSADRGRFDSAGIFMVGQSAAVGDAKMQVSNGLRIGPGVVSTDVNTLDYYQEGTFTPVIAGATTAGAGTYTTQLGRYTRIGNVVFYWISLVWTAHTGTGNFTITGAPFTSAAVATNMVYATAIRHSAITVGAGKELTASIGNNSTTITLTAADPGGAAEAFVAIDTAGSLWISGAYQV